MTKNNQKFEDEIDFYDVLTNPVRWFGLVYPFFLTIIVLIGLYYLTQIDIIEQNKIPPAKFDSVKTFSEVQAAKGMAVKGIDISLLKTPSAEMMEKAKATFTGVCATCHGAEGKGDGLGGASLNPKPRDFTKADGWTKGRKFSDIYRTINEGIAGTGMTGYDYLDTELKVGLAHYIMQFANDFPPITDAEIVTLNEKYRLTEDHVTPHNIPIAKAMEILEKESFMSRNKINDLVEAVKSDDSPAAELLKNYTKCLNKALTFLSKSDKWKQSPELLAETAFDTAPVNGFCPSIAKLGSSKLELLYNYLNSKL